MSTILVTNDTDTPVAGEIDLRQAVAAAVNGDTIAFPFKSGENGRDDGPFVTLSSPLDIAGKSITIDLQQGSQFGFAAGGPFSGGGASIDGVVIVEAGAAVTLENGTIQVSNYAGVTPTAADGQGGVQGQDGANPGQNGTEGGGGGNGAAGADGAGALGIIQNHGTLNLVDDAIYGYASAGYGAAGGTGGDGADGGSGADDINAAAGAGGNGGSGGPGGAGGNGGEAVGAIDNTGTLTIQNTLIDGNATGGAGGAGGTGGSAADGGDGGDSEAQGNGTAGAGGAGGKGGNGGAIGVSGNGGSAIGVVLNTGTLNVVGVALISGTATAGKGGQAGTTTGVDGGMGGMGGSGDPDGDDGKDGVAGAIGADGQAGTATATYVNEGALNGQLTSNGAALFFGRGATVTSGEAYDAEVDWYRVTTGPATATVDWSVVVGASGPALADFTTPTSGTLSFSEDNRSPVLDQLIQLTVLPKASEPANESYQIVLTDPSTGSLLATSTQTVSFVNQQASTTYTGTITTSFTSTGNATAEDLILGGAAVWTNTGAATQAGAVQLGDGTGSTAAIANQSAGTYDIAGDYGIAAGAGGTPSFVNGGTLAKTAGTGNSAVAVDVSDSGTIEVDTGRLSIAGPSNSFAGDIDGMGTFALSGGGTSTIGPNATITTSGLSLYGPGTVVLLHEALTYAGSFSDTNATKLNLGGNLLTLSGPASFAAGAYGAPTLTGTGQLLATNTTTIGGLTIGGADVLRNLGTVVQTGTVTVGNASNQAAKITNGPGATWQLAGDVGIAAGNPLASLADNGGTIAKTAGTTTRSVIGTAIVNNSAATGTIADATGKLELAGPLSGNLALTIGAGARLILDQAASAGTAATFQGSGAELQLSDAQDFHGSITGFGAQQTLDLRSIGYTGSTDLPAYSGNNGPGTLSVTDGTHTAALAMLGSYAKSSFALASDTHGGTMVTFV